MDVSKVRRRIKARREELGLTQGQVAKRVGITQPTYRDLEQGRTSLNLERLGQIAEALEVSIQELISGANSSGTLQAVNEETLLQLARQLQEAREGFEEAKSELKRERSFLRRLFGNKANPDQLGSGEEDDSDTAN